MEDSENWLRAAIISSTSGGHGRTVKPAKRRPRVPAPTEPSSGCTSGPARTFLRSFPSCRTPALLRSRGVDLRVAAHDALTLAGHFALLPAGANSPRFCILARDSRLVKETCSPPGCLTSDCSKIARESFLGSFGSPVRTRHVIGHRIERGIHVRQHDRQPMVVTHKLFNQGKNLR